MALSARFVILLTPWIENSGNRALNSKALCRTVHIREVTGSSPVAPTTRAEISALFLLFERIVPQIGYPCEQWFTYFLAQISLTDFPSCSLFLDERTVIIRAVTGSSRVAPKLGIHVLRGSPIYGLCDI